MTPLNICYYVRLAVTVILSLTALGSSSSKSITVSGKRGDFNSWGHLQRIYVDMNKRFDELVPPWNASNVRESLGSYHSKRCAYSSPGKAVDYYFSREVDTTHKDALFQVLVGSPCLSTDSLGNWLSNYFETVLCARNLGLHYIGVAKVWEPKQNNAESPFISALPSIIPHNSPRLSIATRSEFNQNCPCKSVCHESPLALWTKDRTVIRGIMWTAFETYRNSANLTSNIISQSDLSNRHMGHPVPVIPEVAIHYRCGDNFVGHYGFLPFRAFKKYIPENASSIYVLAERRDRKTAMKPQRAVRCDAVLNALFEYLVKEFPQSTVLVRRGDDLYLDMLRLASARIAICSVSSFCLWPAFVNNNTAYFPLTKLVVKKDPHIDVGMRWITDPPVLIGSHLEHLPIPQMLAKLIST